MRSFREIHVVANTHWDREFRETFEKTRDQLVEMLDTTIDILVADPAYASFTLDAHCILLKDYLEMRPEREPVVRDLLAQRRLLIGPWYTLPDSPNVGAEALARNFLWARRFAADLGVEVMKVGYTPCNWGQPSQLPQIFHQLGIESALFYRGISPHEAPAEWIWVAPDGSEIVGHRFGLFARYNWYYFVFRPATYGVDPFDKNWKADAGGELPFRRARADDMNGHPRNIRILNPPADTYHPDEVVPAFKRLLELESDEFSSPFFLGMHGHDMSVAHPMDPRAVADIDAALPGTDVRMSDLETYMERVAAFVREQGDDAVRLVGERRTNLKEGYWTYLLPGTISARTPLKMDNALTERVLALQAEPLAVLAFARGRPWPERALDRAWTFLLDCHTHDAIAGCASDEVCADLQYRFRQARDLAEVVVDRSLRHIVARLDLADTSDGAVHLVVFNPLPFARDATARVDIVFPGGTPAEGLRITGTDGRPVDFQPVATERDSLFVDSIWDVPRNTAVTSATVIAHFPEIPALGYRTFRAEPVAHPTRVRGSLASRPGVLENRFVRVEVRPDGSFDLLEKQTGSRYSALNRIHDEGVAGNAWKHVRPVRDVIVTSAGVAAEISAVDDGPLESSVEATFRLRVPEDLDARESGDPDRIVKLPIRIRYTLRRDDPLVHIETEIDNRARDHWVRAVFPTDLQTDTVHAETHYDVVDRPIELPDCSDWVEDVSGTAFMQSAVALSDGQRGVAVLSEGLLEYEVFDRPERPIAISLLRAMWIKLEVSEEKKQILPDIGMQCPGIERFRYAVYPFVDGFDAVDCLRRGQARRVPVEIVQTGRPTGDLPVTDSVIDASESSVVVTAVKRAAESERIIVRAFNPSACEAELVVRTAFDIADATACSIDERDTTAVEHAARELRMPVPGKRIVTVALRSATP